MIQGLILVFAGRQADALALVAKVLEGIDDGALTTSLAGPDRLRLPLGRHVSEGVDHSLRLAVPIGGACWPAGSIDVVKSTTHPEGSHDAVHEMGAKRPERG